MSTELDELTAAGVDELDEGNPSGADVELVDVGATEPAGERPEPDDDDEREPDDELDDDDQGDDDEPGEDRPPESDAETRIEDDLRRLELEAVRHAKRVGEIIGEASIELLPCELCAPQIPGFRWPVTIEGAQLEAVKRAIGLSSTDSLKKDIAARACEGCDGFGNVLSGSHVTGQELLKCTVCKGHGWIPVGNERSYSGAPVPVILASGDENTPDAPADDLDVWGTPRGHPEWGMAPQYRTLPLPGQG